MEALLNHLDLFLLVFARIGGMFFFNPIFSRRGVPALARTGIAFGLTLVILPTLLPATELPDGFPLLWMLIQEILIGFACGILFSFYFYLLFMAGDIIDTGFGLSMAKAFDPGSNMQVSLSGNLFQILFSAYFFSTGSHLIFIRLIASSFDMLQIGGQIIDGQLPGFMITMFISSFELAMHLVLPYLAATFILEVAMGILMKLIPQISVFSIHFQLKIFCGFLLLFLFAAPMNEFINHYIDILLQNMQALFTL